MSYKNKVGAVVLLQETSRGFGSFAGVRTAQGLESQSSVQICPASLWLLTCLPWGMELNYPAFQAGARFQPSTQLGISLNFSRHHLPNDS